MRIMPFLLLNTEMQANMWRTLAMQLIYISCISPIHLTYIYLGRFQVKNGRGISPEQRKISLRHPNP